MNIFYLDPNPRVCAWNHADPHVGKMLVESVQLLSTAMRQLVSEQELAERPYLLENIYKKTHPNHPCVYWVKKSTGNWRWLYYLANGLADEFRLRHGKMHKSTIPLEYLYRVPKRLPVGERTDPPLCMQEQYMLYNQSGKLDSLTSYRAYYAIGKMYLTQDGYRRGRAKPRWMKQIHNEI